MKKEIRAILAFVILICIIVVIALSYVIATPSSNIQNGGFENKPLDEIPGVVTTDGGRYAITTSDHMLNWNTTAKDRKIEVGEVSDDNKSVHMTTNFQSGSKTKEADGLQYAELQANESSSLFQNIVTESEKTYLWGITHRARGSNTVTVGQDVLAVIIGDTQSVDPSKNADSKDQLMLMVDWIKENINPTIEQNSISSLYEIYSKPFAANGGFQEIEGAESTPNFSLIKNEIYTQTWKIRLVSSGVSDWYTYEQEYRAMSESTLFALTEYSNLLGIASSGNIIDAIKFKDIVTNTELITNGSFETPVLSRSYQITNAANNASPEPGIGWCSTSNEKKVEIGRFINGLSVHIVNTSVITKQTRVYTPEGKQYVELNANEESSLYQYITTESGQKYNWGLYHRGRFGIDVMALIIGSKQEYDPMKKTADTPDQLMRITKWIQQQPDLDIGLDLIDLPESGCSKKIILYSTPFADNGEFINNENPFSWTKDDTYTEQWNVWLMASECTEWYGYGTKQVGAIDYDNTYMVPEGINEAIIGFVSYNSSGQTNANPLTLGNLIDGIDIAENYRVECYTTPTGSGTYTYHGDTLFTYSQNYIGYVGANETFKILITPDESRNFIGARINGEFISADPNSNYFKLNENGNLYYESPAVLQHYEIRLIFQAKQIVYDSNGGDEYKWNLQDPENSSYEIPLQPSSSYTSHPIQKTKEDGTINEGWRFIGWQYGKDSTLFDGVHTIEYIGAQGEVPDHLRISHEKDGTVVDNIDPAEGVTMVAQWKHRQAFVKQTYDSINDIYVDDPNGGTIEVLYTGKTEEDKEQLETSGEAYFIKANTNIDVQVHTNPSYIFKGWYNQDGELIATAPSYNYYTEPRKENILYARFDSSGTALNITNIVTGHEADKNKYFPITVNLTNTRPNASYKILNIDLSQISVDNQSVYNPQIITADNEGNITTTIYVKDGQTASIANLPINTEYSLQLTDYSELGYKNACTTSTGTILGETTSIVTYERFVYRLRITKNGLTDINDSTSIIPLANGSYTLYTDQECDIEYSNLTTPETGIQTFEKPLITGKTYYLKESKAATGYKINKEIYKIETKDDGLYVAMELEGGGFGAAEKVQSIAANTNIMNISFTNTLRLLMPNNGTFFTQNICVILGIILVIIAITGSKQLKINIKGFFCKIENKLKQPLFVRNKDIRRKIRLQNIFGKTDEEQAEDDLDKAMNFRRPLYIRNKEARSKIKKLYTFGKNERNINYSFFKRKGED